MIRSNPSTSLTTSLGQAGKGACVSHCARRGADGAEELGYCAYIMAKTEVYRMVGHCAPCANARQYTPRNCGRLAYALGLARILLAPCNSKGGLIK